MFRFITYKIIKTHAPKEYHEAFEWEYEGDKDKTAKILRVWLDDDRNDEPFMYNLTAFESQLIEVAWKMCEPDLVPVELPVDEMD